MNYIVIELQTANTGATANIVTTYNDKLQAEQKFHLILSAAAVSQLPMHAAVILTPEGRVINSAYYSHEAAAPATGSEDVETNGERSITELIENDASA